MLHFVQHDQPKSAVLFYDNYEICWTYLELIRPLGLWLLIEQEWNHIPTKPILKRLIQVFHIEIFAVISWNLSSRTEFLPPRTEFLSPRTKFLPPRTKFSPSRTKFLPPRTKFLPPRTEFLSPRTKFLPSRTKFLSIRSS